MTDVKGWRAKNTVRSGGVLITAVAVGVASLAAGPARAQATDPTTTSTPVTSASTTTTPTTSTVASGASTTSTAPPAAKPLPAPATVTPTVARAVAVYDKSVDYGTPIALPTGLVHILVIGSDARPGEKFNHTRGDSIHLVVVNTQTKSGTIIGFPRDSYVPIPGRGRNKINSSLAAGGPDLMVKTVSAVTGIPIDGYVVTGFAGIKGMINDIAGVKVNVLDRMNDKYSGAIFKAGLIAMNGAAVLAYSRNRHGVRNGDFTRSENQGLILLAGLAKLRAETSSDTELRSWAAVLAKHAEIGISADRLPGLLALARQLSPTSLANVVVPGRAGMAGKASVVFLDPVGTARMFRDVADDGLLNNSR